jgi:hypothetical protein
MTARYKRPLRAAARGRARGGQLRPLLAHACGPRLCEGGARPAVPCGFAPPVRARSGAQGGILVLSEHSVFWGLGVRGARFLFQYAE